MNINLAIKHGSKILRNNSISNPQLDSEILMAKTINKDRSYVLINSNNYINKNYLNKFNTLIKQRSLGKPVAYLINKKFFWNSEFLISNDTLIPRPDTELIVENILELTKQKKVIEESEDVLVNSSNIPMSEMLTRVLQRRIHDALATMVELSPTSRELKNRLHEAKERVNTPVESEGKSDALSLPDTTFTLIPVLDVNFS